MVLSIGGRPSFIVHILSVHARVAQRRWEESMKRPRRTFLYLTAGAAALPTLSRTASALDYPTRPVHVIVGFFTGSLSDILARTIAQWLSEQLDQQVIVDDQPGAGGNLATEMVVRARPDGYTLLETRHFTTSSASISSATSLRLRASRGRRAS